MKVPQFDRWSQELWNMYVHKKIKELLYKIIGNMVSKKSAESMQKSNHLITMPGQSA